MKQLRVNWATGIFMLMTSACGTSTTQVPAEAETKNDVIASVQPPITVTPPTTPTETTVPDPRAELRAPIEKSIELLGYTGPKSEQSIEVRTQRILKIRVNADVSPRTAEGTGFTPKYSRLAIAIKVGNSERFTPLLSNGEYGSKQGVTIDLSGSFTPLCRADQPDCSQLVKITLLKANYDYWCFNWSGYCYSSPSTHVHATHWVGAQLKIETDFTSEIKE